MRLCLFLVGVCAGAGASCNKLHGASCNINKFINFVESVRPEKAIYGCWMLYRRCASNWYLQAFYYLHRKFKIKSKRESWSWSYFKFASGHIKHSQTSHRSTAEIVNIAKPARWGLLAVVDEELEKVVITIYSSTETDIEDNELGYAYSSGETTETSSETEACLQLGLRMHTVPNIEI